MTITKDRTASGRAKTLPGGEEQGRIRARGVRKVFSGEEVLHGVDLDVSPGEVAVIIGPSGSGKSTLLRTINALESIDGGMVTIDDEIIGYRRRGNQLVQLTEAEQLRQRLQVGMVFQDFNLFSNLSVLDNITEAPIRALKLPKKAAQERARELLKRVGLADKEKAYPRQLSGGQKQRVAIARALALRPKVVLFDEPTSALDPELVDEVLAVIKELARSGTTLVIVTHEIAFAREVADQVVMMADGEVVETGPPERIFTRPTHRRTAEFLAAVAEARPDAGDAPGAEESGGGND